MKHALGEVDVDFVIRELQASAEKVDAGVEVTCPAMAYTSRQSGCNVGCIFFSFSVCCTSTSHLRFVTSSFRLLEFDCTFACACLLLLRRRVATPTFSSSSCYFSVICTCDTIMHARVEGRLFALNGFQDIRWFLFCIHCVDLRRVVFTTR